MSVTWVPGTAVVTWWSHGENPLSCVLVKCAPLSVMLYADTCSSRNAGKTRGAQVERQRNAVGCGERLGDEAPGRTPGAEARGTRQGRRQQGSRGHSGARCRLPAETRGHRPPKPEPGLHVGRQQERPHSSLLKKKNQFEHTHLGLTKSPAWSAGGRTGAGRRAPGSPSCGRRRPAREANASARPPSLGAFLRPKHKAS